MIVERTKDEILIRLSANIDLTELQKMLDYFEYKELSSGSKATKSDVEKLTKSVNKSIWDSAKSKRKVK